MTPGRTSARGSWPLLVLFMIALGAAALYVAISFSDLGVLQSWQGRAQSNARRQLAPEPLLLPRSADLALQRATALKEAGHLKDALNELDRIGPSDGNYGDALRLRTEIQVLLLAGLPPPPSPPRNQGK